MTPAEHEERLLARIGYSQDDADELRAEVGLMPVALALAIASNVANLDELDECLHAVCGHIFEVLVDLEALDYVIVSKSLAR